MSTFRLISLIAALTLPANARAEVPQVITDILPVHSLAAQVMQGVGVPQLLMPAGADPHAYAMRPSEARGLTQANLIFWIGPELTPWLTDALPRLAGNAVAVELLEVDGTVVLQGRQNAVFGAGDGQDAHESHDTHEDHDHGHNHDGVDPHAWLDPQNARIWLAAMAEHLADLDPVNASLYRTNAAAAQDRISTLEAQIKQDLAGGSETGLFVYHDAYQYFENRFGLHSNAAISQSDAAAPGAARLSAVKAAAEAYTIVCVIAEPQFSPRLIASATGDKGRTAEVDPIGAQFPAGVDQYSSMLAATAQGFAHCRK